MTYGISNIARESNFRLLTQLVGHGETTYLTSFFRRWPMINGWTILLPLGPPVHYQPLNVGRGCHLAPASLQTFYTAEAAMHMIIWCAGCTSCVSPPATRYERLAYWPCAPWDSGSIERARKKVSPNDKRTYLLTSASHQGDRIRTYGPLYPKQMRWPDCATPRLTTPEHIDPPDRWTLKPNSPWAQGRENQSDHRFF